ncbi:ABC transporter ATP-binding protein [Sporosarcina cascadiensis]|uniref:ABC transporter ATP-binding protein n=1 Tax=Sporosarcina cascadiensis TaxID=2660747 RepID=UPI00129A2C2D|nr:dipeptide/oligopeptide/nickel ABC transporter ATP-binding protein [Sporosarcina cascadiensis]
MTSIEICNVTKSYTAGKIEKIVLDNCNMVIQSGEITGLIGRSGSGKSTLSRLLMRLEKPASGMIKFDQTPISQLDKKQYYNEIHIVFQNATASLNPSWTIRKVFEEVLIMKKEKWGSHHLAMLKKMNLSSNILDVYPSQLSGGEKQRINLLRALFMNPSVLICDEIVSNLDRINQKELISLLLEIQKNTKMTILFISHDIDIVKAICSSIFELDEGKLKRLI